MKGYSSACRAPEVVRQAVELCGRMQFSSFCSAAVGRLLHVLAAQFEHAALAEIGTGYGVSTAWIATALAPGSRLITVDIDPERSALVAQLLRPFPNVQTVTGDWRDVLPQALFAMVFADCAPAKRDEPGLLVESLQPGGLLVLDDLTEPVRRYWLSDPRMSAAEILVGPGEPVIVATRVR